MGKHIKECARTDWDKDFISDVIQVSGKLILKFSFYLSELNLMTSQKN